MPLCSACTGRQAQVTDAFKSYDAAIDEAQAARRKAEHKELRGLLNDRIDQLRKFEASMGAGV